MAAATAAAFFGTRQNPWPDRPVIQESVSKSQRQPEAGLCRVWESGN